MDRHRGGPQPGPEDTPAPRSGQALSPGSDDLTPVVARRDVLHLELSASGEDTAVMRGVDGAVASQAPSLVVVYGTRLGHLFSLRQPVMVIGRHRDADVSLPEDAISRRHAELWNEPGQVRLRDLGSTNGTFVNHRSVEQVQLAHGDLIKVGGTILKFLASGNIESAYYEEIHQLTIGDALTGAFNRRHFSEQLEREFSRSRRHGRPLSLALFDIDRFKRINDTYGHVTGDYVLRELGHTVRERIRQEELFARYGGEEFVVLLPETGRNAALAFAEQLRALVDDHQFIFDGHPLPVTISVGVAELSSEMESPEALVRAADAKTYEAKEAGRNRVAG